MRSFQVASLVVLVGVLTIAGGLGVGRSAGVGSSPHPAAIHLARSVPAGPATKPRAAPAVVVSNMGIPGLAPEMTSISWTVSSPAFGYGFSHYELDYSWDGVTWNVYKNITNQSTTTLGYTWCPTCALWWTEATIDSSPVGPYIESSGELLNLTQPANATASFVWSNDTSVWIDWTNPAVYGGNISFFDYELWESVNHSAYALDAYDYNLSPRSEYLTGLTPDTNYSFFVKTRDYLSDPAAGGYYVTNSTVTSFTTPFPLRATATVNRSTADVGQSLEFQCGVTGGVPAYTYGWTFGDGGTPLGSTVNYMNHTYSVPGPYTASCSVFDHADSVSTGQVNVSISAAPTVAAPISYPAGNVFAGRSVTFLVNATVGSGGLGYSWAGLPNGCSSSNASSITCDPSGSGTFSIVVTVTDSNGGSARSVALNFTVKPTFLGLPATQGYWLAGGIAAVAGAAALAVVLVFRRRKKGGTPPPEPSATPSDPLGPSPELPPSSPGGGPPPGASP